MAKVLIYTAQNCSYCRAAKDLLKARGVEFEEILLESDQQWDELIARSGMKTVPQIFYNDSLIGGFTDLASLDKKTGLSTLRGT
ncbi:MAG: glutaredoxin domain-containing protein [Patescibacteria group bacterium]